jgi:alpha-galactosidase
MKKLTISLAALLLAMVKVSGAEIQLSKLELSMVQQGSGKAQGGKSSSGNKIRIAGREFSDGVGTHTPSKWLIELDGKAELMEGYVGVDEGAGDKGAVAEFIVVGDETELWTSGPMRMASKPVHFQIPLVGIKRIALVVRAGHRFGHDTDWADVRIIFNGAPPKSIPLPVEQRIILTPKPGAKPHINGPKVFGAGRGHPFLYRIPCTGERPIRFSATNLPMGLSCDPATGIILGAIAERGEFRVTLRAENSQGSDVRPFKIIAGDQLSLTPQMGFNDWYSYYSKVTQSDMQAAADAMITNGMADAGYQFVNLDDCWEGDRDSEGMIRANERFPDMKGLSDYIHAKGLKFGIYSSPGPKTCGEFEGSYRHEDQDARQFANWGVDFVKYDRCSYDRIAQQRKDTFYAELLPIDEANQFKQITEARTPLASIWYKKRTPSQEAQLNQLNIQYNQYLAKISPAEKSRIDVLVEREPYDLFKECLQKVDRDIVYNLCQYGIADVWTWGAKAGGNSWRTSGDLGGELHRIFEIALKNCSLRDYNGPGGWNDPDYIQIGWLGNRPAPFTPTEAYSFMSLWCLTASPLIYSGNISKLDDFTLGILCNPEVIEVDQDPLGKCARIVGRPADIFVLSKEMEDGSIAVGLCNRSECEKSVTARWAELGLTGKRRVRDLWRQMDLGNFENQFESKVPARGVMLVRIFPETK